MEANAAVLAVHYRRAPEHPAPAAIEDVVAALKWAVKPPAILGSISGSPSLAGDSAGG
ncbi:alpha/beta hydrolase fold domain-containing protein [Pseudarthrobacter sp. PvP090]|uniref:alpha/beta hydrolase fold domain-containing protein n=1 Tax=Pseudarthrobacter sp. PvP090 TaxID=3156393 RepID=UPI0033977E59